MRVSVWVWVRERVSEKEREAGEGVIKILALRDLLGLHRRTRRTPCIDKQTGIKLHFYPKKPRSPLSKAEIAYSCSQIRDTSSSVKTKVCFNTKLNDFLSAGRVLGVSEG